MSSFEFAAIIFGGLGADRILQPSPGGENHPLYSLKLAYGPVNTSQRRVVTMPFSPASSGASGMNASGG